MPKYYCDYCKSYLTHDTLSVRKSHLMGKNHIKYYCDYYEFKAKETGEWKPLELAYEVTFDKLNRGIPGGDDYSKNSNNDIRNGHGHGHGHGNVNSYSNGNGNGVVERRRRVDNTLEMNPKGASYSRDSLSNNYIHDNDDGDYSSGGFILPPPPHLSGMPLPPPSHYNHTKELQEAIWKQTRSR